MDARLGWTALILGRHSIIMELATEQKSLSELALND
jgi:hypothetical protein